MIKTLIGRLAPIVVIAALVPVGTALATGCEDCDDGGGGGGGDTTPPNTLIQTGPAANAVINDTTPTWSFSSSEAGSTLQCKVDGGGFDACTSPKSFGPLGEGQHTVQFRAIDSAANVDPTPVTRTVTIDTTAPNTSFSGGPANGTAITDTTPTFDLASTEASSTFKCSVDLAPYANCNDPFTTAALSNGLHTLHVKATDAAGNQDASAIGRAVTVDTIAPVVDYVSGPANGAHIADNTPTYTFATTDATASTAKCKVDGGAPVACIGVGFTPAALSDGVHTIIVEATDSAGNKSQPVARVVWPDTTAPVPVIEGDAPVFAYGAPADDWLTYAFDCKLDGAPVGCSSGLYNIPKLAPGTHEFAVRATDGVGNVSQYATKSFVIAEPPAAPPVQNAGADTADGGAASQKVLLPAVRGSDALAQKVQKVQKMQKVKKARKAQKCKRPLRKVKRGKRTVCAKKKARRRRR